MGSVIDCHGHYTTTPPGVGNWRDPQKAAVEADPAHVGTKGTMAVSDDEIRESLEGAQLRLQRERGADLTIFSPRASWMGHHIGNEHTSLFWSQHQNDLVRLIRARHCTGFQTANKLKYQQAVISRNRTER